MAKNSVTGLKIDNAVLKNEFKNLKQHITDKFDNVKEELKKGSKRMDGIENKFADALKLHKEEDERFIKEKFTPLKQYVNQNTRFRRDIKLMVAFVGAVFGVVGSWITITISKFFKG